MDHDSYLEDLDRQEQLENLLKKSDKTPEDKKNEDPQNYILTNLTGEYD